MNETLQYLLEVSVASAILFSGHLLLKSVLKVRFKRIYLLCCIFIPVILPFLQFQTGQGSIAKLPREVSEVFMVSSGSGVNHSEVDPQMTEPPQVPSVSAPASIVSFPALDKPSHVFLVVYGFVSLFLLVRLLLALYSISLLIQNATRAGDRFSFWIVDKEGFTGASFFNSVFISKKFLGSEIFDYLMAHEQAHKRYFHSFDVLIVELYCILFWINPVSWFLRREVRLNTELEADHIISGDLDTVQYAKVLVALSSKGSITSALNLFSAMDTGRRVRQILNPNKRSRAYSVLVTPFMVLALWLISCGPGSIEDDSMAAESLKNLKSITTRYISHQSDTQNKDGEIVAIADFLPDGSIDKVTQYMTYPYNFEDPFEITFWSAPNPENIPLILDGLGLGKAEYNFLYGNDWPKKYAAVAEKEHPVFHKTELTDMRTELRLGESGFPVQISTQMAQHYSSQSFVEEFEKNQQDQISNYTSYIKYNPDDFPEEMKKFFPERANLNMIEFVYADDQLISTIDDKRGEAVKSFHFEYQSRKLTQSAYYVKDELYVTRKYYYSKSGLKTRAEIFNVNGEPEYTILYDYAFYE